MALHTLCAKPGVTSNHPFRHGASAVRTYVIRVSSPNKAPTRFAVLAPSSGQAMAAMVADLGLSDIAEITGEVLNSNVAARLGLTPGRPLRLV